MNKDATTTTADAASPAADAATQVGSTPPGAGVEHRRIKHAVRASLFGGAKDPVRIGRFTILRRLGSGGMGVVHSAFDDDLERKVAIKLLRVERVDEHAPTRLLREAQAIARLSHPNVVSVFEIGEHEGRVFLAMEFVRGTTLRDWLAQSDRGWRAVLEVFVQAGRGLAAAHAEGLVHRDFKPDNVMVGSDGRVRVLDFGLAEMIGTPVDPSVDTGFAPAILDTRATGRITRTGAVLGTPAYMSPEQHTGKPTDARTDQFSFCVTLWEALYGTRPFPGDTLAELVEAVCGDKRREAPAAAGVPGFVRAALGRGLASDRDRRFSTMDALLGALTADPGRVYRRAASFALGAALLGGGIALGVAIVDDDDHEICERAADRVHDVWSPTRRRAVEAALVASDPNVSLQQWARASATLDAYAEAWAHTHDALCADTELDADRRLARRLCLQWDLEAAGGLVDALAHGDVELLADIDRRIAQVGAPAGCTVDDKVAARAAARSLRAASPPPEIDDGLVSDFEGDPWHAFGWDWQVSTDHLVGGRSEAELERVVPGAHGSKGALRVSGRVSSEGPAHWAGAMFMPGARPMQPANLQTKRYLSFWAKGTPGTYGMLLLVQRRPADPARTVFEVGRQWAQVKLDLTALEAELFDVTGVFVGAGDNIDEFELLIDDVRLE